MTTSTDPVLSAPLQPALPPEPALVVGEDDVRLVRGAREYRVRGLARNLSPEALKVTVRVSERSSERVFVDTLDLYQARQRAAFVKAAGIELGVAESVLVGDLSALVLALEPVQEQAIRGALLPEQANALPALTEAEEAAGLGKV